MMCMIFIVDGYWDPWSGWEDCDVSCGGGIQYRNRTCVEPLYGGANCTGNDTDDQECNTQNCPGQDNISLHLFYLSISIFRFNSLYFSAILYLN